MRLDAAAKIASLLLSPARVFLRHHGWPGNGIGTRQSIYSVSRLGLCWLPSGLAHSEAESTSHSDKNVCLSIVCVPRC